MKKMVVKRNIALAILAALSMNVFTPVVFAEEVKVPTTQVVKQEQAPLTTEAKIKQFMAQYSQAFGITSLQYAMMDQGKIVMSGQEGVYSKSENAALTKDTMYGIGSTSKAYTAAAVMKLVDMGKVELDQPVTKYIPEFKMADERYKEITLRMLLNHSSGLTGSTFSNAFLFGDKSTQAHDAYLKALEEQVLNAKPGAYSVYCNDGFTLAELVVERVSGMSFTSFLNEYITGPIGAKTTKTPQDSFNRRQLAQTYMMMYPGEIPDDTLNVIGAGGIYSSAEDVCRFGNIFTKAGGSVLSEASVQEMMKPSYVKESWIDREDASWEYGLGWDETGAAPFEQYGIKAVVKGGDTQMSHASLIVLPEKNISIAVVSSGGGSSVNQIIGTMMAIDYLQLTPPVSVLPTAPLVKVDMPKEMVDYTGSYGSMMGVNKLTIKPEGTLSLGMPGMPDLIYVGANTFSTAEGSMKISFEKRENGKIYAIQEAITMLPGYGESKSVMYFGEKLEPNQVKPEVWASWQKRAGKMFFLANEKYSSQMYVAAPMVALPVDDTLPGYISANKVISETEAVPVVEIPQMMGRDLRSIEITQKEGVEYLNNGGFIYSDASALKPFEKQATQKIKIGKDGYTQWFTLGQETADQNLTVTMKGKGAIMVYSQQGQCLFSSYIEGKDTVKLPAAGYIAFAGDANTVMTTTLK